MKQIVLILIFFMIFGQIMAQKNTNSIVKTYIVNIKESKKNKDKIYPHTGKYIKIECNANQGKAYAEEQAKLRLVGQRYTIQTIPIKKGECAVIYKTTSKSGKISLRMRKFKTKQEADKYTNEKTNSKYSNNKVFETYCIK